MSSTCLFEACMDGSWSFIWFAPGGQLWHVTRYDGNNRLVPRLLMVPGYTNQRGMKQIAKTLRIPVLALENPCPTFFFRVPPSLPSCFCVAIGTQLNSQILLELLVDRAQLLGDKVFAVWTQWLIVNIYLHQFIAILDPLLLNFLKRLLPTSSDNMGCNQKKTDTS